jgi:hypothetical protein
MSDNEIKLNSDIIDNQIHEHDPLEIINDHDQNDDNNDDKVNDNNEHHDKNNNGHSCFNFFIHIYNINDFIYYYNHNIITLTQYSRDILLQQLRDDDHVDNNNDDSNLKELRFYFISYDMSSILGVARYNYNSYYSIGDVNNNPLSCRSSLIDLLKDVSLQC